MHINLALEQAVFSVYKNFSWFIKKFPGTNQDFKKHRIDF